MHLTGDILVATELRGPMKYRYNDLTSATKNFSEQNKLGEGGFGDVYKGTLNNGKVIAVKKLAIRKSVRAKADFESEVKLISNVHHRNLSRLLGYCSKRQELLLVYEYMANSSLDKFLFGDRCGTLNWKQRFDIIVGTARDFGLARLLPEDQTHINTRFAGTLGYTAPEYVINGKLSSKVDTYSYGVVVLEIISGRRSNDLQLEPFTEYLLELAWRLHEEDKLIDLVDRSLDVNEYNTEEMKKIIGMALLCTQSSVSRPSMSEVVTLLTSKGLSDYNPTRPTFIDQNAMVRNDSPKSPDSSSANIEITEASGR
ncbi:Cysteine-rich receptor-like protein kinase [Thalictrum thalictroides]|uniref:Cysteine-rich receptor-like protein kinase n=1 Tax=Thalictrum thalictroides TaxID=46969 RepID=A0A7J6UYC6_THATH|nr:Cysteine-rich receptor-like protein kinase [Thalictrum thalictroides]